MGKHSRWGGRLERDWAVRKGLGSETADISMETGEEKQKPSTKQEDMEERKEVADWCPKAEGHISAAKHQCSQIGKDNREHEQFYAAGPRSGRLPR